jgi:D-serine deaminase-like pyridoxal phosphate-dependent protein
MVVYKDRVQHNIKQMIRIAGNPERLMPHIKTYKMIEIVRMQMESGINKFKCATIAESELLGIAGAGEALLAYQPSDAKLNRLIVLIKKFPNTRYSTIIDNIDNAVMINRILESQNINLNIYIDINNGNNRTGIIPDKAYDLFVKCMELKAINIIGLHVYDGHIRNSDFEERKNACDKDFEPVNALIRSLNKKTKNGLKIIAGGSPTFTIHAQRKNVICSPGTVLLWDAGYGSMFADLPFLPAAVLLTRVVSNPADGLLCLDLGHKAVASENPLDKRVLFLNVDGLKPIAHSEEHLVVKNTKNITLNAGNILYGLPHHICPTVALYNEVIVIEEKKIIGKWEVLARTRKINY